MRYIIAHEFKDALRFLIGDETAGDFRQRSCRKNGLDAVPIKAARDAVEFECGTCANALTNIEIRFAPRTSYARDVLPFFV